MSNAAEVWVRWKVWLLSIAAGAALGVCFRLLIFAGPKQIRPETSMWVMTGAFLIAVPMCMGYLSVQEYLRRNTAETVRSWHWFFLPAASVAVMMLLMLLIEFEGAVCVILATPIMLVSSIIGGLLARVLWGSFGKRSTSRLSCVVVPLLLLAVELQIPRPDEVRAVRTQILIHAPANVVWNEIKSVRAIDAAELPRTWVQRIGFPAPVAATLSHEGVGGVRQASFTGGLLFTETVNLWEKEHDLRFRSTPIRTRFQPRHSMSM